MAHVIYDKSASVAKSRVTGKVHRGGPHPALGAKAQFLVGFAMLERVREQLVAAEDRAAFTALVKQTKQIVDGKKPAVQSLELQSKPSKRDAPAIAIAKQVLRAGARYLYSPISSRTAPGLLVTNAAANFTRALAAEDRPAFLAWLDNELVRQELLDALAEREIEPSAEVATILSRPANEKDKLALVVAKLADGQLAIWLKVKTKWEWHEGDRASVFAMVPDAHMDRVAEQLDEV